MDETILYQGACLDTRPPEEKAKDFQHEEVAAAGVPVEYIKKTPDQFVKTPIRDQDGSLTCMAQAGAKVLGFENKKEEPDVDFKVFSARDMYARRCNRPDGGMGLSDLLSIMSKYGATLEELLPSQRMSEAEIDAPLVRSAQDLVVAKKYRGGGYVYLKEKNIDEIASVILHQKKAVVLMFYFKYDEWNRDVPVVLHPELQLYDDSALRHGVAGTDAISFSVKEITEVNGEKALVIDDSWGKFYGLNGQRIITETFLKARCFGAGYVLDLKNEREPEKPEPVKPKYTFKKKLSFGLKKDADVIALQEILKYEQLFPQNIASTGNYLQITARAVLAWQRKHQVASERELASLSGRLVGLKTLAKLNELYN